MSELKHGHVYIDVDRGPEGYCLCIGDGETGERVAGPKPWGGSTNVHSFQVSAEDLIRLANDYQIADGHNENGKLVDWNNKPSRYCPPDWMVEEGKVTELKPLYSQEYVSALLADLEAKDKRIAELEAIREAASRVIKEIGHELGCNPDKKSIMMDIDDLKASQMTGPLKDVLKRNIELEAKLSTPVRLPGELPDEGYSVDAMCNWARNGSVEICAKAIRAAGFTVEGCK